MQHFSNAQSVSKPRGEYSAEHLRPRPETRAEFFDPLWTQYCAAIERGDVAERDRVAALMRPYQYKVSEDDTFSNLITLAGKDDLLNKYLKGSSYTQSIRMGLKGTGTAVVGDTQVSHAGWLEQGLLNAPTYAGSRPSITMGSAVSGVSVSPSQAFAITSTGTVFGCFINNGGSPTIDDTSGVLFSAGDFGGGSKAVANGDTLNITYTLAAT
jgi:hypothetical protein